MKITPFLALVAVGGLQAVLCWPVFAQTTLLVAPSPPLPLRATDSRGVLAQLHAVQTKAQARYAEIVKNGLGPAAFIPRKWADISQAYDVILAAHKNERTDDVAQVALAKAMLCVEGRGDYDFYVEQLQQVTNNYPGTPTAAQAATLADKLQGDAEAMAARRQLIGQPLPDFAVADLEGQPLSPARFKGKVLLVDFWGPGCVPCLLEMPKVARAYARYRAEGFEVLGSSLAWGFDGGLNGRLSSVGKNSLRTLLKTHDMAWPEYCFGVPAVASGPHNELDEKLHVFETPANYLVGRDGKIIAVDLFGDDLADAVAKAIATK